MLGEYTESSSVDKEGDSMGDGNILVGTSKLCSLVDPPCLITSTAGKRKYWFKQMYLLGGGDMAAVVNGG